MNARPVGVRRSPTLLAIALRHIDNMIQQRRAEHDNLVKQLQWLEQQKQQLLDEAAAERARRA